MRNGIIKIENESKIYFVNKDDIMSISVDSNLVGFYLENGDAIYKTASLQVALELLPEFVQINRNCAINVNKIKELSKKTRTIKLKNDKTYKVSARQMPKLRLI
jgi:DNA-binding LytR/AlgR family response regulator